MLPVHVEEQKNNSKAKSKKSKDSNWELHFLIEQFQKESDRAAVILITSILDELLLKLLKCFLVPISSSEDNLFDNANSPLSNFSSKIDISFRLGLISNKFSRDLHLIRKIRNSFAHDIFNCNFENGAVKSRIDELEKSIIHSQKIDNIPRQDDLLKGSRGMFLYLAGFMIWQIKKNINNINELSSCLPESLYIGE